MIRMVYDWVYKVYDVYDVYKVYDEGVWFCEIIHPFKVLIINYIVSKISEGV